MRLILFALTALLLSVAGVSRAGAAEVTADERVYIVKDYRYVPGTPPGDLEIGQSLCGTRCNALSFDYLNVMEPGGWRVIKVASNVELTVELRNPFMKGTCVCLADEYLVKPDTFKKVR
jgi:hypothetical protein